MFFTLFRRRQARQEAKKLALRHIAEKSAGVEFRLTGNQKVLIATWRVG